MKNFIKRCAAALGAVMLSAVSLAAFYSADLPESYSVAAGEELKLNTLFPLTVRLNEKDYQPTLSSISAKASGTAESTLMLFGTIPVKTVTASEEIRPCVVPCGEPFGIKLLTDGVMVVDISPVGDSCPARECGIIKGDIIVSVNGEDIRSNTELRDIIRHSEGRPCEIFLRRGKKELTLTLDPVFSDGIYKAGMWVRDSSAGIGTLTFYDENSGTFGGLGHAVCDSDTGEILPLSEGAVGDIKISGYIPSDKGSPGQLLGEFSDGGIIGEINLNCEAGLFGTLYECPSKSEPIPLGYRHEVQKGEAVILSSIDGGDAEPYDIVIEQTDISENAEHDMIIKVTDKRLLEATGGIVQGMSGSPIIQNGCLVGAVTHVFVEDPSRGYGIFADRMFGNIKGRTE